MPVKKNHYEILGVPRTATPEQIKRRYRQLVRQHHPDVAQDKAAAKSAFLQISEAYQTLIDPDKRLIYDASIDAEMFRVEARRPKAPTEQRAATSQRRTTQASHSGSASGVRQLVQQAQSAFLAGQFPSAIKLCKEARKLDPRNLQATIILGDIYKIQGRNEDAIAMYSIAVQLDPKNADLQNKLDRLVRLSGSSGRETANERQAALRMGLNLISWSIAGGSLAMLALNPGDPIPWLRFNLPVIGTWSTMLIAALLASGAVAGFTLSINESVQPLDEELIFQGVRSADARGAHYPVGALLLVFNVLSFYLAATVYVLIGLIQECLSKSVVKALVTTFALVVLTALIYWPGSTQVLLFGGNLAFPAVLLGWFIGDLFRPTW